MMRHLLLAATLCAASVSLAYAGDAPQTAAVNATAAVLAPIQQLIRVLNDPPAHLPPGLFAAGGTFIDKFAPYYWSGPNGAGAWYAGFLKLGRDEHMTAAKLSIGDPLNEVSYAGARAYLTVPLTVDYVAAGKHRHETGDWTFVMQKTQAGTWKILSHAFELVKDEEAVAAQP